MEKIPSTDGQECGGNSPAPTCTMRRKPRETPEEHLQPRKEQRKVVTKPQSIQKKILPEKHCLQKINPVSYIHLSLVLWLRRPLQVALSLCLMDSWLALPRMRQWRL